MLEKQVAILNEKEQNITIESQKISKELIKWVLKTNDTLVKQIEAYEKYTSLIELKIIIKF